MALFCCFILKRHQNWYLFFVVLVCTFGVFVGEEVCVDHGDDWWNKYHSSFKSCNLTGIEEKKDSESKCQEPQKKLEIQRTNFNREREAFDEQRSKWHLQKEKVCFL